MGDFEGGQLVSNVETPHRIPPISKLNPDILSTIFMINVINSRSPENHPLITSRHSSQVCREWRGVILGFPLLWARLIDLAVLDLKTETWRNEVLRRSASAPLWIRGVIYNHQMQEFLLLILNNHWSRIEELDVQGIYEDSPPEAVDVAWIAFSRPAPILREFKISFGFINGHIFSHSDSRLFKQHAPVLQYFSAPAVSFSLTAPWISNLREILLSSPFTAAEILEALRTMPSLEQLQILSLLPDPDYRKIAKPTPPSVDLPRLTKIRINFNPLDVSLPILESITPALGCTLNIDIVQSTLSRDLDPDELEKAAVEQFFRYIRGCFSQQTVARVSLHFFTRRLDFVMYDSRDEVRFKITVKDYWHFFNQLIRELALSPLFTHILRADLIYGAPPTFLAHSFFSFISSLSSVTDVTTDERTLKMIFKIYKQESLPLLPLLHTLALQDIKNKDNPSSAIKEFLKLRKTVGLPISVIDFTRVPAKRMCDTGFLEEVEGLKVVKRE